MKRTILAGVGAVALLLASSASAHTVSNASLSCNQSDFSYAYFPTGTSTIALKWSSGQTTIGTYNVTILGPSGNVTVGPPYMPDLSAYAGRTVTFSGTWTADRKSVV